MDAPSTASNTNGGPGRRFSTLRWGVRLGVPLIALTVIATAIVWLQRPDDTGRRIVAESDVPLDSEGGAPQEGAQAPDFQLAALDDSAIQLSDLRGRIVVLNFWATWCGPCRDEMPLLEQASADFDGDVVVVAINVQGRRATVRQFLDKLQLTYRIGLDQNGTVARRYHVRSFPTTYFIGRDGRVEGRRVGAYTRTILYGRLEQLLDQR